MSKVYCACCERVVSRTTEWRHSQGRAPMGLSCYILSQNNLTSKKRKATSELLPATKGKKATRAEQHGPLRDRAGMPSGLSQRFPDAAVDIEGITGPEGDAESTWSPSAAIFDAGDEGDIGAAGSSTQFDENFTSDVTLLTNRDHARLASPRNDVLQRRWGKMNYCPDDNMDSITGDRDEEDSDNNAVMDDDELPDESPEEEDDMLDSLLPVKEAWDDEFMKKSVGTFSLFYRRLLS